MEEDIEKIHIQLKKQVGGMTCLVELSGVSRQYVTRCFQYAWTIPSALDIYELVPKAIELAGQRQAVKKAVRQNRLKAIREAAAKKVLELKESKKEWNKDVMSSWKVLNPNVKCYPKAFSMDMKTDSKEYEEYSELVSKHATVIKQRLERGEITSPATLICVKQDLNSL